MKSKFSYICLAILLLCSIAFAGEHDHDDGELRFPHSISVDGEGELKYDLNLAVKLLYRRAVAADELSEYSYDGENLYHIVTYVKEGLYHASYVKYTALDLLDAVADGNHELEDIDASKAAYIYKFKVKRIKEYIKILAAVKYKIDNIHYNIQKLKEDLSDAFAALVNGDSDDDHYKYIIVHKLAAIHKLNKLLAKFKEIVCKGEEHLKELVVVLMEKIQDKLDQVPTPTPQPPTPTPQPPTPNPIEPGTEPDTEDMEEDEKDGESIGGLIYRIWFKLNLIKKNLYFKNLEKLQYLAEKTLGQVDEFIAKSEAQLQQDFQDINIDSGSLEECIEKLEKIIYRLNHIGQKIEQNIQKIDEIVQQLIDLNQQLTDKEAEAEQNFEGEQLEQIKEHFALRRQQILQLINTVEESKFGFQYARDIYTQVLQAAQAKLVEKQQPPTPVPTPVTPPNPIEPEPTPPPVPTPVPTPSEPTPEPTPSPEPSPEKPQKPDNDGEEKKTIGDHIQVLCDKLELVKEKIGVYEDFHKAYEYSQKAAHQAHLIKSKVLYLLDHVSQDHEAESKKALYYQIKAIKDLIVRVKGNLLKIKEIKQKLSKIQHVIHYIIEHLQDKLDNEIPADDGETRAHLEYRIKHLYEIKDIIEEIKYCTYKIESIIETVIYKLLAKLRGKLEDGEIDTDIQPIPHYPLVADGEDGEDINECFDQIWYDFTSLLKMIENDGDTIDEQYYKVSQLLEKAYEFRAVIQRIIKNIAKKYHSDDKQACIDDINRKLYVLKHLAGKVYFIKQKCFEISELVYQRIEHAKYVIHESSDGEEKEHYAHKLFKLRHIAYRLAIFKTHVARTGRLIDRAIHKYHLKLREKIDNDGEATPPPPPSTPPLNTQMCSDNLGDLMDAEGNTLMDNRCEPEVQGDDTIFKFTVNFVAPYIFNDECLDIEVVFEETILENGNAAQDQWSFNPDTQEIVWNIALSKFVDVYECEWIADEDQFTWVCEFKVNLYFMGMIQLCYNSKLQVTLDRLYENELIVNVQKNEVIADCCENELGLDTAFEFCETFECNTILPSPLTVIRKEEFFVQQRITTPGFNSFFLQLTTISLGDFLPVIVQQVSEPGRIRIALRSNIAKPGLILTIISQLHKTNPGGGRFLQQSIRDDYKLKASQQISIVNSDELQQENQQYLQSHENKLPIIEQEKQDLILISIIGASAFISIVLVAGIICYMRKKQKHQQKPVSDSDNVITESVHTDNL